MSLFDYSNKSDAEDLITISGHVKWFDAAKGYGFIVPQDVSQTSMRDVLLHISSLRDIGRDTAQEGARITCKIAKRAKGWQVISIDHIDQASEVPATARADRSDHAPRATRNLNDSVRVGDLEAATIKWFNRSKGYGFVVRGSDPTDIFIPLLIGTGGNAGTQITTTLIRAMAVGEVRFRDVGRVLRKEIGAGVLIAATIAVVGWLRAWTLGVGPEVALTVAVTVAAIVLWSALIASVLKLKRASTSSVTKSLTTTVSARSTTMSLAGAAAQMASSTVAASTARHCVRPAAPVMGHALLCTGARSRSRPCRPRLAGSGGRSGWRAPTAQ